MAVKFVKVDTAASGDTSLVAADSKKAYSVESVCLVAAGAVTAKFKGGSTDLTGAMSLITGTPLPLGHNPSGWFKTNKNEALVLTLGGAVQVSGVVVYREYGTP